MKNEADVWKRLRDRLPADVMSRRIEDASGNLGTHDTFLARDGKAAWLELKYAGRQAKPQLRKGQRVFALKLLDAGIITAYLVGHPDSSVRLIGPMTDGEDWRDHVINSWDQLGDDAVNATLGFLGL